MIILAVSPTKRSQFKRERETRRERKNVQERMRVLIAI